MKEIHNVHNQTYFRRVTDNPIHLRSIYSVVLILFSNQSIKITSEFKTISQLFRLGSVLHNIKGDGKRPPTNVTEDFTATRMLR